MSTYEVPNLVYGMHHLNITQLPGGDFSHPNMAMDLAGQDAGVDFWFAKCCDWKCIAGEWGSGTYFFIPCDSKGNHINIMCADGKQRKITIALTHSKKQYVKTERGKIYSKNQPMYEEGTKGKATGNHIHLEIAEGYKTTKYYDSKLGVYTMGNELNPVKMFYVLDGYTKVVNTKGATLPHTKSEYTKVVTVDKYAPTLPFTQPDTNKIVNAHRYDFTYKNFATFIKNKGGYNAYVNSLGGVFTKWHNKNVTAKPTYKVTTVKEFKECADYVWGLMTIYGVNYTDVNGKKVWGSSSGTYGDDAFYDKSVNLKQFFDGSTNKNGFKVGIDQILSGSTKGGMMTNCGWSVTYLFHKAGLIPADGENMEVEFYGNEDYHKYYRKKGAKILTPKNSADFKVGDVIGFYGSGTGFTYKHCCVVVDVNKQKGTYTIYDGGSARFTKTRGNNIVGKLGDSPLYGSYTSFKVLRLPLNLKEETTSIKYVNATGVASYYDKNKGGTYKVTAKDGLHIRNDGVQSAKSLGVLPYNTEFKTYGYYDKDSQGREWLYGVARVGNTEYTGFCCSKSYLKKV